MHIISVQFRFSPDRKFHPAHGSAQPVRPGRCLRRTAPAQRSDSPDSERRMQTDERHVAFKILKLAAASSRMFPESVDSCDKRNQDGSADVGISVRRVDTHRAELVYAKYCPFPTAHLLLPEQHRSRRIQADCNADSSSHDNAIAVP